VKISNKDIALIASKLINFPSVTPSSSGSVEFLENILSSFGFNCIVKSEQSSYGSNNPVINMYAYRGEDGPNVCFAGHLDVVPPGENWLFPPFGGEIKDGKVLGRGAVDMKGAIASAVVAFLEFASKNKKAKLSFLLTTDEEGVGRDGTCRMLKHIYSLGHKIDFAVVGEPTCMEKVGEFIATSRRGSANFKLRIFGTQGHVAYKGSFENPISIAVKVASALENVELDHGNENFGPSSLTLTSFDVFNSVVNLVPSSALLCFNVRFNNNFSSSALKEKIVSIIENHCKNFDLEFDCPSEVFASAKSHFIEKFALASQKINGIKPIFTSDGATSDARFISFYSPCLEFGLQYLRAHQVNEWVLIEDLVALKSTYLAFLDSLYC
jgi:succinyl-diaminopimelate desuccinylase